MLQTMSLAMVVVCAHAYPYFGGLIPNGRNVTGCDGSAVFGVGHIRPSGGGPRNSFGLDWAAAGFAWTVELCNKDSDGDGMTNGRELGDPNCVWTPESTPSITEGITHPGQNCQPVPPTPAPTPAPTLAPTPAPMCEVTEFDRMDCGFSGINETGCLSRGCCWRSSSTQGVPWCYDTAAGPPAPLPPTPAPTSAPTLAPTPAPTCEVTVSDRMECGFYGIDEPGCLNRGCCWRSSSVQGVPWCYDKVAAPPVTQCQVPENERQDCGYIGINQDGCEASSCCWVESQQSGVPWCFYGVQTSPFSSFKEGPPIVQPRKASRHKFLKPE